MSLDLTFVVLCCFVFIFFGSFFVSPCRVSYHATQTHSSLYTEFMNGLGASERIFRIMDTQPAIPAKGGLWPGPVVPNGGGSPDAGADESKQEPGQEQQRGGSNTSNIAIAKKMHA